MDTAVAKVATKGFLLRHPSARSRREEFLHESLEAIVAEAGEQLEGNLLPRALALYLQAAEIAERAGDRCRLSGILGDLAVVLRRSGELSAAIETNRRAIAIAHETSQYLDIARWSGNLGGILFGLGDLGGADACFREAVEAAARSGSPEQVSIAAGHMAGIMGGRGRYSDALETIERACSAAAGSPGVLAILRENELALVFGAATGLRKEGRLSEAREVIDRALSRPEVEASPSGVQLLMLSSELYEYDGNIVSACETLERAARACDRLGERDQAAELRTLIERMES